MNKQQRTLLRSIDFGGGLAATKAEINYVYFFEDYYIVYFKQGMQVTVPYGLPEKKALKAIEDAAFALLDPTP